METIDASNLERQSPHMAETIGFDDIPLQYGMLPHPDLFYTPNGLLPQAPVFGVLQNPLSNSSEMQAEVDVNQWSGLGLDFDPPPVLSAASQSQTLFNNASSAQSHDSTLVHPQPQQPLSSYPLFLQHANQLNLQSPTMQAIPQRPIHNSSVPPSLNQHQQFRLPQHTTPTRPLSTPNNHFMNFPDTLPFIPSPMSFHAFRSTAPLLDSPAFSAYSPSLDPTSGSAATPLLTAVGTGKSVFGSLGARPAASDNKDSGQDQEEQHNLLWNCGTRLDGLHVADEGSGSDAVKQAAMEAVVGAVFRERKPKQSKRSRKNKLNEEAVELRKVSRKEAEKHRRDEMKKCIDELKTLVPKRAKNEKFASKEMVLEKAFKLVMDLKEQEIQKLGIVGKLEAEVEALKRRLGC
ncbi:hypothetical protein BDR26DRAFT_854137 [Obelidium mucronatum]|nr:hypothetical protein BDR26DRAFT_854137 [Obelidium mucronatum]